MNKYVLIIVNQINIKNAWNITSNSNYFNSLNLKLNSIFQMLKQLLKPTIFTIINLNLILGAVIRLPQKTLPDFKHN